MMQALSSSQTIAGSSLGELDAEVLTRGGFVEDQDDTWYRIEGNEHLPPFLMTLAGDCDVWAFISSTGGLTAGRRDEEGAFLPYETVDKIHTHGDHSGPRTWVLIHRLNGEAELWEPFTARLGPTSQGRRSVWKNLSGTRIRFREEHALSGLAFQVEWFSSALLGLVRFARLEATDGEPCSVTVLDGILNLMPPNVGTSAQATMSNLSDAYKWNEVAADGRLGLYTLYARIWDRAEPKESLQALTVWHAGLPANTCTLLSANQVERFCRGGKLEPEFLTRGRRGAFLVGFDASVEAAGQEWHLVIDGPRSQVESFELAQKLASGGGTVEEILNARQANCEGLDELLAQADGFQQSADGMAAAHHRANVLFNIMRGGVFVDGTRLQRDDLTAFVTGRNRLVGAQLAKALESLPAVLEREDALAAARKIGGDQAERLVLEYLPLTFSRRHGDPSRPWNRFAIHVRDAAGRRVVNYAGNWRDIFQNWEGLVPSEPAFVGSMITAFLGAMTPDGYNPYRVGRDGIDWEVVEPDNPWSNIGYWGDHQIIYLLRLMEAAKEHEPNLLPSLWDRALFSFGDVPYRLKPYAEQVQKPKETIDFDHAAHRRAQDRRKGLGADGLLVCDDGGQPVLATFGEKLAVILLAKAGSLLPGGGLWLHTQRPEWNDANNALVGNGLSVVTLAYLRRFLMFLQRLPGAERSFSLPEPTLVALERFGALVRETQSSSTQDAVARRAFLDQAGALLDEWRAAAYQGAASRTMVHAPEGMLTDLANDLLPLVDATLECCRREDGLFDSYNIVRFTEGRAEVSHLYPMLEGQVALLSCGFLTDAEAVKLLQRLFESEIYASDRNSFLLYPDRKLPGFFEKNQLDADALALPIVQDLLAHGRTDVLQRQSDGTVRFAPGLSNRGDLEAVCADLGDELAPLVEAYERLLRHREFTGRSGTMFGYEGLGSIYWHMVAKLLLAVQERVFDAADRGVPELDALKGFYRRIRDGLGYRKSAAAYGAFPADPYSHTPAEGGAKQPGMTGQVKEEILTRWGELGLRMLEGQVHIQPVLLDVEEIPVDGVLRFTRAQVPYAYRRADAFRVRVQREAGWEDCSGGHFDPRGVQAVEVDIAA